MRTAKEIINEFKAIADNPRKAMDDYKKETGKGAVGIMPVYCPEEIVHAAGYLPIGMWGAQKKQISKARTYLPPFACSIMQSVMELQLEVSDEQEINKYKEVFETEEIKKIGIRNYESRPTPNS